MRTPSDVNNGLSRRKFLLDTLVLSAASFFSLPKVGRAEPPPETTKLRIWGGGGVVTCVVPVYAAQEQLLRAEGFTDVEYIEPIDNTSAWPPDNTSAWPPDSVLQGEADISLSFPPTDILRIESGAPLAILGGSHIGCVNVVGGKRVRSTPDLKGKAW